MRLATLILALSAAAGLSAGAMDNIPGAVVAPTSRPAVPSGNAVFNPQFKIATPVKQREMAHRWGFGLDFVPGASAASVLGNVVAAPNGIGLRWWPTDKLALDGVAALASSSLQTGTGTNTPGTTNSAVGFGVGVKYNISEPSQYLLAQLVGRGSVAKANQNDTTGLLKLETTTTALFVGAGFEAFVPGWEWLSLEGSAGLSVESQEVKPTVAPGAAGPAAAVAASQASQSTSSVTLGGNGFTPINLSIHVYF